MMLIVGVNISAQGCRQTVILLQLLPAAPAAPVAETTTDTGWKEPAPAATPEPTPAPAPAAEAAPAEENAGGAQDILAMIRARQGQ